MKRLFFLKALVFVIALCAITGCALFQGPDKAFVSGVDAAVNQSKLLDQYDAYVDADTKLTADSKKIRKDTSRDLRKLILDAKGEKAAPPAPPTPSPTPTPPPPK
jgi:hypothetical protein